MFITIMIILETILLQNLIRSNRKVTDKLKMSISYFKDKNPRQVSFTELENNGEGNEEIANNGQIIVETNKNDDNQKFWILFSILVDRLFLIILVIIYTILYFGLFP